MSEHDTNHDLLGVEEEYSPHQLRLQEAIRMIKLVQGELQVLRRDELVSRLNPARDLLTQELVPEELSNVHYSEFQLPEVQPLPTPDALYQTG